MVERLGAVVERGGRADPEPAVTQLLEGGDPPAGALLARRAPRSATPRMPSPSPRSVAAAASSPTTSDAGRCCRVRVGRHAASSPLAWSSSCALGLEPVATVAVLLEQLALVGRPVAGRGGVEALLAGLLRRVGRAAVCRSRRSRPRRRGLGGRVLVVGRVGPGRRSPGPRRRRGARRCRPVPARPARSGRRQDRLGRGVGLGIPMTVSSASSPSWPASSSGGPPHSPRGDSASRATSAVGSAAASPPPVATSCWTCSVVSVREFSLMSAPVPESVAG